MYKDNSVAEVGEEEVNITRKGAYTAICGAAAKAKRVGCAEISVENEKYYLIRGESLESLQCLFADLKEVIDLSDKQVREGNATLYDRESFLKKFGHLRTLGEKS